MSHDEIFEKYKVPMFTYGTNPDGTGRIPCSVDVLGINKFRNAAKEIEEKYKTLLAELYQVCGVLGASEKVLDNISAAAAGKDIPHATLLPYHTETKTYSAGVIDERERIIRVIDEHKKYYANHTSKVASVLTTDLESLKKKILITPTIAAEKEKQKTDYKSLERLQGEFFILTIIQSAILRGNDISSIVTKKINEVNEQLIALESNPSQEKECEWVKTEDKCYESSCNANMYLAEPTNGGPCANCHKPIKVVEAKNE